MVSAMGRSAAPAAPGPRLGPRLFGFSIGVLHSEPKRWRRVLFHDPADQVHPKGDQRSDVLRHIPMSARICVDVHEVPSYSLATPG